MSTIEIVKPIVKPIDKYVGYDKQIYIDQDNLETFKMVFKPDDNDNNNIEKEFIKKKIYTLNPTKEIIGHIAYTNHTITVTGSPSIDKSFINYIYFEEDKIVVIIDELIAGKIEDIVANGDNPKYIKFTQNFENVNNINLSFVFVNSTAAEINFDNYFFLDNDKKYYFTSGKCNNNESYYINSFNDTKNVLVEGNLFYAFLQIFYPEKIYDKIDNNFYIHKDTIKKAEELQNIVKNVYIDSIAHPNIKKYYNIPDNFKIFENEINKTVNLEEYLIFINKEEEKTPNVKLIPNNGLEILSKYFNLNCNVIEFKENELKNNLNKINRDIEDITKNTIKSEGKFLSFIDKNKEIQKLKKNQEENLKKLQEEQSEIEKKLEKMESNNDSIPIKNIQLNDSEGCVLYPFIDEKQIYPYTFCNLDGEKWYLKKHNCELDYDIFKGGANERYDGLKSLSNLPVPPPVSNTDTITERDDLNEIFVNYSYILESNEIKYLFIFPAHDNESEPNDNQYNEVDINTIKDNKDKIVFKKKDSENRAIVSYQENIKLTKINTNDKKSLVYEIKNENKKYYVIPL